MSQTSGPEEQGGSDGEDILAAEYALGVLNRDERVAAEARSENDEAFAQDIFNWVARLSALFEEAPSIEPTEALWLRIQEAIGPEIIDPQASDREPLPPAANDRAPRGSLIWRIWAISATAVAAAALLFIGLRPGGAPVLSPIGGPAHTLVATLGLTAGGAAALAVAYDPNHSTIYASPDADFSIPQARAAELWLIPADGKPRPLGLIDPSKPATMPMPPQMRGLAQDKATLALSIEPVGGSPTGLPTGPVVAAGKLSAV